MNGSMASTAPLPSPLLLLLTEYRCGFLFCDLRLAAPLKEDDSIRYIL